jgi:putative aldouronate transport system substrate-binding protein
MKLAPLPYPVKNKGDVPHIRQSQQMIRSGLGDAISTSVTDEEMPIICRFYDYMFSEEGCLLANWGIEGTTFEYDAGGNPQYTELIMKNPDGLSFLGANAAYLGGRNMAGVYEWTRELNESSLECVNVWSAADDDWIYPENATMTSEEGTEFATVMGDAMTFMIENCIGFIIGSKSFDEWDSFVQSLKDMGVERCVEIKQDALDRYNEREKFILK